MRRNFRPVSRRPLSVLALSFVLLAVFAFAAPIISAQQAPQLVVYSGRSEQLVGPVFERFTRETGIRIVARYGDTAQLAAVILEEGDRTPADVFFAQDAGALGALTAAGRLQRLPGELLDKVDPRLRSHQGYWVGASGRARVIAYNTQLVPRDALPTSIWDLTEPQWQGRLGWAPTNGSFQAFVTALRVLEGEERAEQWLRAIIANRPRVYPNNRAIVDAVGRGEIHAGLVNHYYLFQYLAQQGEQFPVRNHYTAGDAGSIVNIAGVGVLAASANREAALKFVEFLLSEEIQQYFTDNNYEYPVITSGGVATNPLLLPLADIKTPDIDLTNLQDLQGTLELLQKVGAL